MRLVLLALLPIAVLACNEAPATPMSYARCVAPTTCGISTGCEAVALSTTGASASICTAPCITNLECPGWAGRCVQSASADGGAPRCFLACSVDADCRPGTLCLPLEGPAVTVGDAGLQGVCAPDLGPRLCAEDSDCAPFALRCLGNDAGIDRRCRVAP